MIGGFCDLGPPGWYRYPITVASYASAGFATSIWEPSTIDTHAGFGKWSVSPALIA